MSEVEEDKGVREHEEKSQKRRWKKQRWRVGRPLEGLPFFLPPQGRRQLSQRRNATTVSPPSAASLLLRQMGPRRRRVVESESMSNRPTHSSSPASPEAADHRHPCHGWPRCLDAPSSSYSSMTTRGPCPHDVIDSSQISKIPWRGGGSGAMQGCRQRRIGPRGVCISRLLTPSCEPPT